MASPRADLANFRQTSQGIKPLAEETPPQEAPALRTYLERGAPSHGRRCNLPPHRQRGPRASGKGKPRPYLRLPAFAQRSALRVPSSSTGIRIPHIARRTAYPCNGHPPTHSTRSRQPHTLQARRLRSSARLRKRARWPRSQTFLSARGAGKERRSRRGQQPNRRTSHAPRQRTSARTSATVDIQMGLHRELGAPRSLLRMRTTSANARHPQPSRRDHHGHVRNEQPPPPAPPPENGEAARGWGGEANARPQRDSWTCRCSRSRWTSRSTCRHCVVHVWATRGVRRDHQLHRSMPYDIHECEADGSPWRDLETRINERLSGIAPAQGADPFADNGLPHAPNEDEDGEAEAAAGNP